VLETEAFSIATRLYVAMRQKLGRITDVQWMLLNSDYADEVVRIARTHTGSELAELADRFETVLTSRRQAGSLRRPPERAPQHSAPPEVPPTKTTAGPASEAVDPRYVGRLR
jgi:hypothetical protein